MSDAEGMRTVIVIAHDPAQAAHILLHYVSDELLLLVRLHAKLGLHIVHKLSLGLHLCLGTIECSGDLTGHAGNKSSQPLYFAKGLRRCRSL